MQIIGVLNGKNKNYDYQLTAAVRSLLTGGTLGPTDLLVTSGSVAAGAALIEVTRTNGQKVLVHYQNTDAFPITTTGTTKVYVLVDQAKIDDGSANAADGTGIATIASGASYPAANFIPLATIVSGVITDDRSTASLRGHNVTGVLSLSTGADMASATTLDLATATGNTVYVTGTASITSLGTVQAGAEFNLVFDAAATIVYNATSMRLPGTANITTAQGDVMRVQSRGSGNWRCLNYTRYSGQSLVSSTDISGATLENDILGDTDFLIAYDVSAGANRKVNPSSIIGGINYFGDGSDGDVTISVNTTLVRDMYYNNLTINTGVWLKPNGFRVFVKQTLTRNGTGYIVAAGGDGQNATGGTSTAKTAGSQANAAGTLPASTVGGAGANKWNGGQNAAGNGTNTTSAIITAAAANPGSGGTGGGSAAQAAGTSGTNTGTLANPLKTYHDCYSLIDFGTAYVRAQVCASPGGGGAGGFGGSATYSIGGDGGGSGSPGGILFVCARRIVANNTNVLFDCHGGNGGTGGAGGSGGSVNQAAQAAGGGGGGAGAHGGVAIVFYSLSDQTVTALVNVAAGTGGALGTGQPNTGGPAGSNGSAGSNGTAGVSKVFKI